MSFSTIYDTFAAKISAPWQHWYMFFCSDIFFSVSDSIGLSKVEIWWTDIRSSDTFKVRYFDPFFCSIEYRKIDKSISQKCPALVFCLIFVKGSGGMKLKGIVSRELCVK
jgi:hypothetical protein